MELQKILLDNGIPLYYAHMPHVDTVAAGVLVKAGTRHEIWPKEAGIAHALEHMRFQGTELFPTSRDVSAFIEDVGGVINAWTSGEGTFFYQKIPATEFSRAPKLLSQQFLFPLIPEEKINTEMQNIVQEIRRAKDDNQQFALMEFEQLIYSGHPLSRNVLGTEESVTSFTRSDFLDFSQRLYLSSRTALIVVGNIPGLQAMAYFGQAFPKQKQRNSPRELPSVFPENKKTEIIHERPIEQVHMVMGYPLEGGNSRSVAALSLFSEMIGGGMSFPLFQIVRDEHGLCYSIYCDVDKNSDYSMFYIYIGTNKHREAKDLILKVIKECKNDRELLERAKSLALGKLALSNENPAMIMNIMARDILYRGEPKTKQDIINEIKSIKIEEIEEAVSRYLKEENLNKVIVGPESLV